MGSVSLEGNSEDEDDHEDNDKVPLTEELKIFVGTVCNGGRHRC